MVFWMEGYLAGVSVGSWGQRRAGLMAAVKAAQLVVYLGFEMVLMKAAMRVGSLVLLKVVNRAVSSVMKLEEELDRQKGLTLDRMSVALRAVKMDRLLAVCWVGRWDSWMEGLRAVWRALRSVGHWGIWKDCALAD